MPSAAVSAPLALRLEDLAPAVAACGAWTGSSDEVWLSLLCQNNLPDSSTVLLARDARGRPGAVVLVSARAHPEAVRESVARARSAAADLGEELGRRVLLPLGEGRVMGLSYAILPYGQRLCSWPVIGRLQRRLLLPALLDWLRGVAQQTRTPAQPGHTRARIEALHAFARRHGLPAVGRLAAFAGDRLTASAWHPVHVAMHADLWSGNLLIAPPRAGASRAERLVMVDWGAYTRQGHGLFDLLKAAYSLRCPPRLLRRELLAHCRMLECEVEDAISNLAASLGCIVQSIGHFPPARFGRMAHECIATLEAALPELAPALPRPPAAPVPAAQTDFPCTEAGQA